MKIQCGRAVFLASLLLHGLYAQSDTGRIAGTITDATNAAVQNATVTVRNEKTGQVRRIRSAPVPTGSSSWRCALPSDLN